MLFLKKATYIPSVDITTVLKFLENFLLKSKIHEEAKGLLTSKSVTERRNEQTSFPSSNPSPNLPYVASLRPKGLSEYPHFP